jgi:small subunit ribosomal protein S29
MLRLADVSPAVNTVNSTTSYVYDARTRTYLQTSYAYQTLHRFLTVNSAQLKGLTTSEDIAVEKKPVVPKGTPLADLIALGMKDQSVAPTVLSAVLEELGKQTKYPVLMAVDDFQSLYCKSAYRDPQFERINSYHLSMPRLLLDYASGKKSFVSTCTSIPPIIC